MPVRHRDNPCPGTHYAYGALDVKMHWVFFVADWEQSTIYVWDSLADPSHRLSPYAAPLTTLTAQFFRITAYPAASFTDELHHQRSCRAGAKGKKQRRSRARETRTPRPSIRTRATRS